LRHYPAAATGPSASRPWQDLTDRAGALSLQGYIAGDATVTEFGPATASWATSDSPVGLRAQIGKFPHCSNGEGLGCSNRA
jgi:hypothetical protein